MSAQMRSSTHERMVLMGISVSWELVTKDRTLGYGSRTTPMMASVDFVHCR